MLEPESDAPAVSVVEGSNHSDGQVTGTSLQSQEAQAQPDMAQAHQRVIGGFVLLEAPGETVVDEMDDNGDDDDDDDADDSWDAADLDPDALSPASTRSSPRGSVTVAPSNVISNGNSPEQSCLGPDPDVDVSACSSDGSLLKELDTGSSSEDESAWETVPVISDLSPTSYEEVALRSPTKGSSHRFCASPEHLMDDTMPVFNVIDSLGVPASSSATQRDSKSPVVMAEAAEPEEDLVIQGRVGHGACINGIYDVVQDRKYSDRPMFRQRGEIAAGFAQYSGKRLALAFYEENNAWALSLEPGSMDVIAYVLGDVLDPVTAGFDGSGLWFVSNGQGQYESDSNMTLSGKYAPTERTQLYDYALSLPTHSSEYEEEETAYPAEIPAELDTYTPHGVTSMECIDEDDQLPRNSSDEQAVNDIAAYSSYSSSSSSDSVATHEVAVVTKTYQASSRQLSKATKATTAAAVAAANAAVSETESEIVESSSVSAVTRTSSTTARGIDVPGAESAAVPEESHADQLSSRSDSMSSIDSEGHPRRRKSSSLRRLGQRISTSFRRLSGRESLKKRFQDTKNRLYRMSGRETPGETLHRLAIKLETTELYTDHAPLLVEANKALARSRNRRDELPFIREALVSMWAVSHRCLADCDAPHRVMYFDVILSIMTRDEVQLFTVRKQEEEASWVKSVCELSWKTHQFVIERLSSVISDEQMLIFCAKVLAINYLVIPDLAQVIVAAISRGTPITTRRCRMIGARFYRRVLFRLVELEPSLSPEMRHRLYNFFQLCGVNLKPTENQCPATAPKTAYHHEHAVLFTPPQYISMMQSMLTPDSPDLLSDTLWSGHRAVDGLWTHRFITKTAAGFGFFSVFMEVLVRRAHYLFLNMAPVLTESLPADQRKDKERDIMRRISGFGDNSTTNYVVFMPGFTELVASYSRLSLISRLAIKQEFLVNHGPPGVVCNWTDRTAACALTLSLSGVYFSALWEELMLQTSLLHVADVMTLLSSLKAMLESYHKLHIDTPLPSDIDMDLFCLFFRKLLTYPHYIVLMFTMRWLYDCLDHFPEDQRSRLTNVLVEEDVLNNAFCHWEPGVRHLFHNLVVFRFFHPSALLPQTSFVQALRTMLEHPVKKPQRFRPMAAAVFLDSRASADTHVSRSYQKQCALFMEYLQKICDGHVADPPFSVTALTDEAAANKEPCYSLYGARSVEQLMQTLVEGQRWIMQHRAKRSSDDTYPALAMSLPPLQNMTSMYSKHHPSRK
eukprot:m.119774 g.119774  ORF g.119774 m.119774 type:complete len:1250 (+) comp13679_c2_seq6:283-4032(+)